MGNSIAIVRNLLITEENKIDYMYKDTKGFVTVGVGYLLRHPKDASSLNWRNRKTKHPATLKEIEIAYNKVAAAPTGNYNATFYRPYTSIYLESTAIESLLDRKILEKQRELRIYFPDFDSYPNLVQEVLTDMAYNFGTSKIINGFPTFTKHIKAKAWDEASNECRSSDISEKRNIGRKNKLLAAWKITQLDK